MRWLYMLPLTVICVMAAIVAAGAIIMLIPNVLTSIWVLCIEAQDWLRTRKKGTK